jgi:uncharacterized protein (UPF0335 family)
MSIKSFFTARRELEKALGVIENLEEENRTLKSQNWKLESDNESLGYTIRYQQQKIEEQRQLIELEFEKKNARLI